MKAPTLVRRVDPRRPALTTPQGLRRIVLGSDEGDRGGPRGLASAMVKPVRSTGPFKECALVVAHADGGALDEHVRQVIAAAAILAPREREVVVAVLGECRDDAAALGIDRLLVQPRFEAATWQPDAKLAWLDVLVRQLQPVQLLMADRDGDGDLARRHAVAARKDIACNVVELDRTRLRVRAGTQDACRPLADVMLLARGIVDADLPFVGLGHRESAPAVVALSHPGMLDLGVVQGDPQSMPLEEADLILAAGNGVADLELFKALAHELGAVVGASRVAVDKGSFARHQQIGATGKTVRARGYLAVGISGAVQHLQGIRECRHVVAINLDAAAPIVRRADLTVVEDAGALMSALLDIVREHRAQEKRP